MNNYRDLYWFFESKIDKKTCKKIIELHNKEQKELGRIGTFPKQTFKKLDKKQNKLLKEKRNSFLVKTGYLNYYNLLFLQQIKIQVGILV